MTPSGISFTDLTRSHLHLTNVDLGSMLLVVIVNLIQCGIAWEDSLKEEGYKDVPARHHDRLSRTKRPICRPVLGFEVKTGPTRCLVMLGRWSTIMGERGGRGLISYGQGHI